MITLYSGMVVQQPLLDHLIPRFEAEHDTRVAAVFEPTTLLIDRITRGERPDLFLGVSGSLVDLAGQGILDRGSITEIVTSAVGYARFPATPPPSDASTGTFLRYLINARAVAYSLSGASGLHFIAMMRDRGLLDQVDERAIRFETGLTAEAVLDGRAELAIQQVSELKSIGGGLIVRSIPHELQGYTRFSVGARIGAPSLTAAFIELIRGRLARRVFEDAGLDVGGSPRQSSSKSHGNPEHGASSIQSPPDAER